MPDEITPKEETVKEAPIESVSEPVQAPEEPTAQIPVNEPLETLEEPKIELEPEIIPEEVKTEKTEVSIESEPVKEEIKTEIPESTQNEEKTLEPEIKTEEQKEEVKTEPESKTEEVKSVPVIKSTRSKARELLIKARNAIQFRKRKKLDKVMTLFLKQSKITNDEVEKFMHVSDATATRYLNTLEKENKIKQNGKTGKSVFYSKI